MSKVAFCFPGQGSLEAGMGRDIAGAVPEAMEVFRIGSEASGLDLVRLCFEAELDELVETEVQQPALVATSLAILAALSYGGVWLGVRADLRWIYPFFYIWAEVVGTLRAVGEGDVYGAQQHVPLMEHAVPWEDA